MRLLALILTIVLTSCGFQRPEQAKKSFNSGILNHAIDLKLKEIHAYYVIGQNLKQSQKTYLKIMAVKTQIEESEKFILRKIQKSSAHEKQSIVAHIQAFSVFSRSQNLSIEGLLNKMMLPVPPIKSLTSAEIQAEYSRLVALSEFRVFEKNIEHLSYMMEVGQNLAKLDKKVSFTYKR